MKRNISSESEYLERLIADFMKILYLYEEGNETTYKHVHSTINQLLGLEEVFTELKRRPSFVALFSCLEFLYDECLLIGIEDNHPVVRREVLKCTNIISKLKNNE